MAKCDIENCDRGYRKWSGTCMNPCGEQCAHNSDYVPDSRPIVLPAAGKPLILSACAGCHFSAKTGVACSFYDVCAAMSLGR